MHAAMNNRGHLISDNIWNYWSYWPAHSGITCDNTSPAPDIA